MNETDFTYDQYKAFASANYILDILEEYEICLDCTNLKLQKLLYFAYGIFLNLEQKPLFNATIQAWKLGPVFPDVYRQFKDNGSSVIRTRIHILEKNKEESVIIDRDRYLTKEEQKILDIACLAEGNKKARKLVDTTHLPNSAWSQVYDKNKAHIIIPNDLIQNEFQSYVPIIEKVFNGKLACL